MKMHSNNLVFSLLIRSEILIALGSLMLFGAWLFQSVFEAGHRDRVSEMHRLQVAIDIAQLRAEIWLSTHHIELNKPSPDDAILLTSGLQGYRAISNIEAWQENRLTNDKKEIELIYERKADRQKNALALFKARDSEGLSDLFMQTVNKRNQEGKVENWTANYINLRNQLSQKATNARILYILFYILGSSMLGMHWYLRLKNAK